MAYYQLMEQNPANKTIGRFAPSPTGPLHIGSLVAAVGSFALARANGGQWLMRMEDLDQPRVIKGMDMDILRTLEGLGFEWDCELIYQSSRTEAYIEAFEHLVSQDAAFACGCTRKELREAASAPHNAEEEPVYPGTCRHGLPPGKQPRSHRVKIGDGAPVKFTDLIQGPQSFHLTRAGGDFVILRADGVFAYQLAVVVDDAWQGVNQVVRGADLLGSTPRQIHLQRLLGYQLPSYAHLPLVVESDGQKLSKRDAAISLSQDTDLERTGAALLVAALRFLGQKPPCELLDATPKECTGWAINNFDASRVPSEPAPLELVGADE